MESVIATREDVLNFLSTQQLIFSYDDIYGYGYGSGPGYGDRYGSGNGYCTEYGVGYGYGYINSTGDGYGIRCGRGNDCNRCDGYGYGYSNGGGDNDGTGNGLSYNDEDIKALNGNIVDCVDRVPTIITQVRNNFAKGFIVKSNLTLSPCYIAKVGNSFAHGYTLKEAFVDAERKGIDKIPIEERIKKFVETFGSLDSEHNGKKFYDWHHILTGSGKMGRDEFCRIHNIDLKKKYTVRHFLGITDESYGRDIIKLIRKSYKEIEE